MNTWIVFSGFSALLLCLNAAHGSRTSPCHCCSCLLDLERCCLPLLSWSKIVLFWWEGKGLSFPHCVAICEVGTGVAMFSWPTINQSLSHTSFFFFFLYRSLCGWKRPSSEAHSLFFPYVSGTFITLSFRQEQSHSSLNQQKFSISWKLNSSAPEISLITSHSQCAIWIILHRLRETRKITSLYFL